MSDDAPREFLPLDPSLFPSPAREFIQSASDALGVDATFIVGPLLSAMAASIGNSRSVQVKPGWTEPAVIWTAIAGPSGSLKSPAMKVVLNALHKRQSADLARFKDEQENYETAVEHHTLAMKAWKAEKGRDGEDPPKEPRRPIMRRTVASDATTEAVARLLQANPRGILLAVDELAGWLDGFNAYKGGKGPDAARWLEIWNAGTLIVDRVSQAGVPIIIERSAVSVCGGIQPGVLARTMAGANTENGLAARLLVAMPPVRPALWSDRGIDPAAEEAMIETLGRLLSLRGIPDDDDGERPRVVYLDASAQSIFRDWHDRHAEEQAAMDEAGAAVWSKLKGYAVRFALVLHMMEACSTTARPEIEPDRIDAATMVGAIALADWYGEEALRVAELLGQAEEERDLVDLVDRIKRMGGSTTVRSLTTRGGKYKTAALARDALTKLQAAGYGLFGSTNPGKQGGRPSERFVLAAKHGGPEGGPEPTKRYGSHNDTNAVLAECRPATMDEAVDLLGVE